MPATRFDTLFRSLKKGELAGAYYLHGPEDILKDEAIQAILDRALDPALRDFNFDQRSAGQLDPEAIFTLCTTLPMMAERRVVLLRDVEGWKRKPKVRAAVLNYLERPSPETVLILVQGAGEESEDTELARRAYAVASIRCRPTARSSGCCAAPRRWASRSIRTGAEHLLAVRRRRARRAGRGAAEARRAAGGRAAHRRTGGRAGRHPARRDDLRLARRGARRRTRAGR